MLCLWPHTLHAETVEQVRISDLERRFLILDSIPSRVSVLESQVGELVYWARGIGTALGLAMIERALRAFGVSLKKD